MRNRENRNNDTKKHIVYLADMMIRSRGFNGFSFKNISGVMDHPKSSIHYNFPTKADLGIKVIEEELRVMAANKRSWDQFSGEEQLRCIINIFFQRSRRKDICLTGALASAYQTYTPEMKRELSRFSEESINWLGACLEKGRQEGKLYFHGTVADRALLLSSVLMSSLLMTRLMEDHRYFDRMIDQQMADLGSSIRADQFKEEIPEHLLDSTGWDAELDPA